MCSKLSVCQEIASKNALRTILTALGYKSSEQFADGLAVVADFEGAAIGGDVFLF